MKITLREAHQVLKPEYRSYRAKELNIPEKDLLKSAWARIDKHEEYKKKQKQFRAYEHHLRCQVRPSRCPRKSRKKKL